MSRFFGTPDGVHVGQQFVDRRELRDAGVHLPLQSGISGTRQDGADSIVVSGGYGDDQDYGDYILYTGHGGKDSRTSKQIADQSIDAPGNAGLLTSKILGLPVRVTRGAYSGSVFGPPSGYRYAGLFLVTEVIEKRGKDSFKIIQFRLDRIPEQAPYVVQVPATPDPAFATMLVTRRIRDSAVSRQVKATYDSCCQVCGVAIGGFEGRLYAEGAHVRPLGRPHLGADRSDNVLCLCPNHHTQLDIGGMFIRDDMTVEDRLGSTIGVLTFSGHHILLRENAAYHRSLWKALS